MPRIFTAAPVSDRARISCGKRENAPQNNNGRLFVQEEETYYEKDDAPAKRPLKGALLCLPAFAVSTILVAIALVATVISAVFSFLAALFRMSFSFPLAAKYSLSVTDRCVTLFFTLVCEIWFRAFH